MKKLTLAIVLAALVGGAALAYGARARSAAVCPSTPDCPNIIDPVTGEEICPREECRPCRGRARRGETHSTLLTASPADERGRMR